MAEPLEVEIGVTAQRLVRQLAQAEQRMVRTATQMERRFGRANERVTRGFNQTRTAADRFANNSLRQVSLQLNQVAQVASITGRPLQALAVQLPDLLIPFGTLGILAGTAAGSLVALAGGASGAGQASESLADSLEGVVSHMGELRTGADELVRQEALYQAAIEQRGRSQLVVSDAVVDALGREIEQRRAILEFERAQARVVVDELRGRVEQARAEFDALVRAQAGLTEPGARAGDSFAEREALNRRLLEQTQENIEANRTLQLELAAQNAELALQEATLDAIEAALSGSADTIMTGADAADLLEDALANAAGAGGELADIDIATGIAQAANEALRLVGNLDSALGVAARLASTLGSSGIIGRLRAGAAARSGVRDGLTGLIDGAFEAAGGTDRFPQFAEDTGRGGGGGQSERNELMREAEQLTRRLRTETEQYNAELARINELASAGLIDEETADRALADLESRLGGIVDVSRRVGSALDDVLDSLIDGTGGAIDAVRSLGRELLKLSIRQAAIQFAPGLFGSGGLLPLANANGNAFLRGRVQPFARGGIVSGPTLFPMANGAGLMGEAGPEAVMPLTRINGRLGVDARGAAGSAVNVVIHNNSTAQIRADRRRGADGGEIILATVEDGFATGRFDQAQSRFGASPQRITR